MKGSYIKTLNSKSPSSWTHSLSLPLSLVAIPHSKLCSHTFSLSHRHTYTLSLTQTHTIVLSRPLLWRIRVSSLLSRFPFFLWKSISTFYFWLQFFFLTRSQVISFGFSEQDTDTDRFELSNVWFRFLTFSGRLLRQQRRRRLRRHRW